MLTIFGAGAVAVMLVCYALEARSSWFSSPSASPALAPQPTAGSRARGLSASSKDVGRPRPAPLAASAGRRWRHLR